MMKNTIKDKYVSEAKTARTKLKTHNDSCRDRIIPSSALLNAIYDLFDVFQQDEFDWRKLFFMLHILRSFQERPAYHHHNDHLQFHRTADCCKDAPHNNPPSYETEGDHYDDDILVSPKRKEKDKECGINISTQRVLLDTNHHFCYTCLKESLLKAFQFYSADSDDDVSKLLIKCIYPGSQSSSGLIQESHRIEETHTRKQVPLAAINHVLEYLLHPDAIPLIIEMINRFYFDQIGSTISFENAMMMKKMQNENNPLFLTYPMFEASLQHLSINYLSSYQQE